MTMTLDAWLLIGLLALYIAEVVCMTFYLTRVRENRLRPAFNLGVLTLAGTGIVAYGTLFSFGGAQNFGVVLYVLSCCGGGLLYFWLFFTAAKICNAALRHGTRRHEMFAA